MANKTANEDTITLYKDKANEWRWKRVCNDNKKIVGASTESYKNKSECKDNAERQFIKCDIKINT